MAEFVSLLCPSCGGRTDFTASSRQVTCQYCGNQHLFQLANQVPEPGAEQRRRPRQPRPRSVRIEQVNGELRLKWRWFTPKYIPMAFFCIAWDSFLIFWYGMAFGMQAPWIFIVFPIAHLAVGVGLTYATLAGFFNTTTVRLSDSTFMVQHDPLPWPGEVKVPVGQLQQFFCRAKSDDSSRSYQLVAVLQDGQEIDLVSGLDGPNIAWFLEQQLEAHLRIADEPVAGELPHPA
jgi:hypothetical protein